MKKMLMILSLIAGVTIKSTSYAQLATATIAVSAQVVDAISLTVDMATSDFGILTRPVTGSDRTASSTLNLAWDAPSGGDWHIEMSSDNASNLNGLIDSGGITSLPLKLNHAGIAAPGDIDVTADWNNNWRWIFDPDDSTPLFFTDSNSSADNANIDFTFGIQVDSTSLPVTFTGTVTFELIAGL